MSRFLHEARGNAKEKSRQYGCGDLIRVSSAPSESRRRWDGGGAEPVEWTAEGGPKGFSPVIRVGADGYSPVTGKGACWRAAEWAIIANLGGTAEAFRLLSQRTFNRSVG